MVQEKYGVRLATQEKGRLRKMIRAGRSSAQAITRARILIKIDEGWTAPQVATALDRVGADRVPHQAAVCRGRTGRGAEAP